MRNSIGWFIRLHKRRELLILEGYNYYAASKIIISMIVCAIGLSIHEHEEV